MGLLAELKEDEIKLCGSELNNETHHPLKFWLKLDPSNPTKNIPCMIVAFEVSQFSVFDVTPLASPLLKFVAFAKKYSKLVMFDTSHEPMF